MKPAVHIFWFRRDLRLHDNAGLYHALRQKLPVLPLFIFDRDILDQLEDRADRRVEFIYQAVGNICKALEKQGSSLRVEYGKPAEIFSSLFTEFDIRAVYTNHDYEPYARKRDEEISSLLKKKGAALHTFKDQVIFEKDEVIKDDGTPYTVFTPYSRKWKAALNPFYFRSYPVHKYMQCFLPHAPFPRISLEDTGFRATGASFPPPSWKPEQIRHYHEKRDFPAAGGTSRLSVHLRFGTISIRELARETAGLDAVFLNELIWRDFYQAILWHFPQVTDRSFKPEYDNIAWRNNEKEFDAWCRGKTGYPIVDAGMRELEQTGYMHNRVRMIVASFLTKHLLIDWRWGEAWFAAKLLDYDLAANNGGWQWAAGSGCDAAPYFRVFNPYLQTKKFDPDLRYIRQWVPELEELSYPGPVVEHEAARKRCLAAYSAALKK